MTKAYFYLKDVFRQASQTDGNYSRLLLNLISVDGVGVFLPDYYTERNTAFNLTSSLFEYSDCTDDGTKFDVCEIGGISNSWNPFKFELNSIYDNIVNGKARGSFDQSVSGNPYGFEGMGLGFDKLNVPINDIPSGGSSGAYSNGAFFVNFDETKSFEMVFIFTRRQSSAGGSIIVDDIHRYGWDPTSCKFTYLINDQIGGTTTDVKEWAFLSGGSAGWIDFNCGSDGTLGNNPIVTQSICVVPTTPTQPTSIVTEALDECCYQSPVLASSVDAEEFKNDINGFLFKRNFSSETITLTLQKNGITDLPIVNDDFGIYYDFGAFGDYPNYKGIQIQWKKVLLLHGEGVYRLKVESTFVSGPTTTFSIPFKLNEYSQTKANGTFRIQSIMNRYLEHIDFDFTGLNWVDGLRVDGFFGNRQSEYEDEYIIFSNRNSMRNKTEMINNYSCQTMLIPDCITDQIIEYHNFSNKLLITDYNLNNHKKTYVQKEVVFNTMETIEYNSATNFARIELKYKDFNQNYLGKFCK